MINYFSGSTLSGFISNNDYSSAARALLAEQLKSWKGLKEAYDSLNNIETKTFTLNNFTIKVQHNPRRINSSSAKVDKKSINERKCFLCSSNLYREQKAVKYGEDFLILVNPFPIFPEHFTIPHLEHIPQGIKGWFGKMLQLSKDFPEDVIIYNGPACGASAPDHLHFQALSKFFMPVDNDFSSIKKDYGEILVEDNSVTVTGIDDGLRKFISIESSEMHAAEKAFDLFLRVYSKLTEKEIEPMMNIVSFYEIRQNEKSAWRIIIFLRAKHRSFHYFREKNKILLSPAAVDLGGVCVLPLENDFNKIKADDLIEIFQDVSLGKEQFEFIKTELKKF